MSDYFPGIEFECLEQAAPEARKGGAERPRALSNPTPSSRGPEMTVTKIEDFQTFKEVINSAEKVLVKFEADWCVPCRAMASVVEEVAKKHPDFRVLAVDVDGEGMEEALQTYGVRTVPTFVRIRQGSLVRSTCGTVSKAELASFLEDA